MKGILISFEGSDGCGKSTQLKMLCGALKKMGRTVLVTREPGGTRIGKILRSLVLNPKNTDMSERAELFLYLADRAQHAQEVIKPALDKGAVVLVDRYLDSTWVYQGFGRDFSLPLIEACNAFAVDGCMPDVTLVFDIDVKKGLARCRRGGLDRMERQRLAFHRRVREGFRRLEKRFARRVVRLDGSKAPQEIHRQVCEILQERFGI